MKKRFSAFGLGVQFVALPMFMLFVAFTQTSCESTVDQFNNDGYASRFGVMAQGPDGVYRVYAETTLIHKQVDPEYVHGFEVKRKDEQRFMGFFEIRFPEPINVTPDIEKAFQVSEGGRVIRSLSEIHWGIFSSPFWFSKDDPLGTYRMTIFIDGDEYRTVEYEVAPFGNEVDF